MIGIIFGAIFGFSMLGAAWTVDTSSTSLSSTLGGLATLVGVFTAVGVFLFPRTVGMAFSGAVFVTPIAFVLAIFRNGFSYALAILLTGVAAWVIVTVIAKMRPDATL
jgi:hypothetical protein